MRMQKSTKRYVVIGVGGGVYLIIVAILIFLLCRWLCKRHERKKRKRFSALASTRVISDSNNVYSNNAVQAFQEEVTPTTPNSRPTSLQSDVRSEALTVYEEMGYRTLPGRSEILSDNRLETLSTPEESHSMSRLTSSEIDSTIDPSSGEPLYSRPDLTKKNIRESTGSIPRTPPPTSSPSWDEPLTPDLPPRPDNLLQVPLPASHDQN